MEKDVVISIKGMQKYEGMAPDITELVTKGRLSREGESYILSYQESELTGLGGTLTTFQVEGGQVTHLRVGEFNSQMVFQEGRRHLCLYDTGFGSLTVGVFTSKLKVALGQEGGSMDIRYTLDIDSNLSSQNELTVTVAPRPRRRAEPEL